MVRMPICSAEPFQTESINRIALCVAADRPGRSRLAPRPAGHNERVIQCCQHHYCDALMRPTRASIARPLCSSQSIRLFAMETDKKRYQPNGHPTATAGGMRTRKYSHRIPRRILDRSSCDRTAFSVRRHCCSTLFHSDFEFESSRRRRNLHKQTCLFHELNRTRCR